MTSWRDLAPKLTADQVVTLERCEANPTPPSCPPPGWSHEHGLLAMAESYVVHRPWWRLG